MMSPLGIVLVGVGAAAAILVGLPARRRRRRRRRWRGAAGCSPRCRATAARRAIEPFTLERAVADVRRRRPRSRRSASTASSRRWPPGRCATACSSCRRRLDEGVDESWRIARRGPRDRRRDRHRSTPRRPQAELDRAASGRPAREPPTPSQAQTIAGARGPAGVGRPARGARRPQPRPAAPARRPLRRARRPHGRGQRRLRRHRRARRRRRRPRHRAREPAHRHGGDRPGGQRRLASLPEPEPPTATA